MIGRNKNNETDNPLENLGKQLLEKEQLKPIAFDEFMKLSKESPLSVFRDIFQIFHDMVHFFVEEKKESKRNLFLEPYFKNYNFEKLLQEGCSSPFFADRLFANRFMALVNSFKDGTKNNQIILFEGPPGSGKSTFLNNLLFKLEDGITLQPYTIHPQA